MMLDMKMGKLAYTMKREIVDVMNSEIMKINFNLAVKLILQKQVVN